MSNGVPAFEPPKSRNAAATLAIMGALAITMFVGITILAVLSHVHMAEDPANLVGFHGEQRTALKLLCQACPSTCSTRSPPRSSFSPRTPRSTASRC